MLLSTTWLEVYKNPNIRDRNSDKENKTMYLSLSWPLSKVISNGCFVEAFTLVEELSNVVAGVLQQVILYQELDPLWKRQSCMLDPAYENMQERLYL